MADWSALPKLAVAAIADRLPLPLDYVRLRAVCSSWRSAAPRRFQFPLLVVYRSGKGTSLPPVFSLSTLSLPDPTLRLLSFPLPDLGSHCCGSSYGWLALLDSTPAVSLFNPLTGASIRLPPFTRFSSDGREFTKVGEDQFVYTDDWTEVHSFKDMQWSIVHKVVLSADPGATDDYVALAVREGRLEFFRSGGDAWMPIKHPHLPGMTTDVLFYGGQFYVSSGQLLLACRLEPGPYQAKTVNILTDSSSSDSSDEQIDDESIDENHLVEVGGDLFVVHLLYCHRDVEKFLAKVFKLDLTADQPLLKTKSVGEYALFLGANQSFSLPVSKFPGLKKNHIYVHEYYYPSGDGIRVINMENCYKKYKNCSNDFLPMEFATREWEWEPLAWIMPSLSQ